MQPDATPSPLAGTARRSSSGGRTGRTAWRRSACRTRRTRAGPGRHPAAPRATATGLGFRRASNGSVAGLLDSIPPASTSRMVADSNYAYAKANTTAVPFVLKFMQLTFMKFVAPPAKVVFSLAILNRFWLGMIIKVSTLSFNSVKPFSATCILFCPSKSKGLVTTATVKIPFSFAALAITGAAPEPVPPPIPVVIKSMFISPNSDIISSIDSSAAFLPVSAFEPAPRPEVTFLPS